MTVYELIATSASNDWASRGEDSRIGFYTTRDKAEARIEEIKKDKEWRMSWAAFNIREVTVE